MFKVVITPYHFMGLSKFSASHKPIKSVKGNSSLSLFSVFWFSSHQSSFPLSLYTSYFSIFSFSLFFFPVSFVLILRLLISSFSLPSPLISPLLYFRLVLSSLYYVVTVGDNVCDSNLNCLIISCCSVAEL